MCFPDSASHRGLDNPGKETALRQNHMEDSSRSSLFDARYVCWNGSNLRAFPTLRQISSRERCLLLSAAPNTAPGLPAASGLCRLT